MSHHYLFNVSRAFKKDNRITIRINSKLLVLLVYNTSIYLINTSNQIMFQALCTSMNDYDRFSPTKQNFLCNGQSALETILNHEDFNLHPHNTGNKSVQLGIQLTPPMFNYGFQKSSLSLILVLDISQQMQAHWVRTRDALFRLVSHIPTGIEIFFYAFFNRAMQNFCLEKNFCLRRRRHSGPENFKKSSQKKLS